MKNRLVIGVIFGFVFSSGAFANFTYTTTDLGAGRWQYTYDVTNDSLSVPIEEFTIWFDYDLYYNLAIETADPPASSWDELVWQPDPVWSIDGGYDALTLGSGIGVGETVRSFAVSFDLLGTGEPGPQFYEVINPDTFATIESGQTVIIPAPSALMLAVIGLATLKLKKFKR